MKHDFEYVGFFTALCQKSNQDARFLDTLSDSTYAKKLVNSYLPGHEEEERDGSTLSNIGAPGDWDRTTQDDTVWVVDLAELVGRETYVKLAVSKSYRRKHHQGGPSTRTACAGLPTG